MTNIEPSQAGGFSLMIMRPLCVAAMICTFPDGHATTLDAKNKPICAASRPLVLARRASVCRPPGHRPCHL